MTTTCTVPGCEARVSGELPERCGGHQLAAFEAADPGVTCEECGEGLKDQCELKVHEEIFHAAE